MRALLRGHGEEEEKGLGGEPSPGEDRRESHPQVSLGGKQSLRLVPVRNHTAGVAAMAPRGVTLICKFVP